MKKLMFLLLLVSSTTYAANWQATITWPTPPDADALTNVHCDINASAATKRGQAPVGDTSLTFNFTANQGDTINCATQLERDSLFGDMGDEVTATVPFLAPGKGPTPTIMIKLL